MEPKPAVALEFVRHPRARRYILRLTDRGVARVTIPRGGSIAEARQFAVEHADWIERQRARQATDRRHNACWTVGSQILFRGEYCGIDIVEIGRERHVVFADQSIPIAEPCLNLRLLVETHLKQLAAKELPPRVIELAASASLPLRKVVVRDQSSRWGSCSRRGTVSLNWRLVQTPGWVCDYLIWHELMHLREMNHSRRFWSLVASMCSDYKAAERWLRQKTKELFCHPAVG
ncbi:MAG: M48 family metallopeptidase [Verrucomicrobia bacterium]|nr:M48 family metallopeptidase [Verrucomicrobiota bacterium]